MPRVTVSVLVILEWLLNLTDGSTRSSLRLSEKRLLSEPWREKQASGAESLTQARGRVVKQAAFEGMLVPSAANPVGVNLIVFPHNLLPRSNLAIINIDQLPARP